MMEDPEVKKERPSLATWAMAARPKTLPAAFAPVLVGTALAVYDNVFALFPALAALFVALLLQIGVNLANDYFDCKKGIDTPERQGPVRVTQSGLISPESVKRAMALVFVLAGAAGLYLAAVAGPPVLVLGAAAILSALAYSGGPFPLASNSLGDLFVFVFFGPVAVCGTYFVQAGKFGAQSFWLSLPVGFLVTAIIVVNNLRDIRTDKKTGKITLAVRLGRQGAIAEFQLLVAAAYFFLPVYMFLDPAAPRNILAPIVSAPFAVRVCRSVQFSVGRDLNKTLAASAGLAIVFSVLLSLGILLG